MQNNIHEILDEIQKLEKSNMIDLAFEKVDKLVKSNKKNALFLNIRGFFYLRKNQLDNAINDFKKAISIQPQFAEAHMNLGVAQQQKNNTKLAILSLERSILLDSNNFSAQLNLGILYFSNNMIFESIDIFKKVIKLSEQNIQGYIYLAKAFLAINKVNDALEIYFKAHKIHKNSQQIILGMGQCFKYLRKKNQAINLYLEALKNDKSNVRIIHALVDLDYPILDEQLKCLEELSKINDAQDFEYIHFTLFRINENKKNYDQGFYHLNKANQYLKDNNNYIHKNNFEFFEKIKKLYNFIEDNKLRFNKLDEKKIIFVVGMPRSGTSLIEQVLSSSEEIYAAGELSFFPFLMNSLLEKKCNQKMITSIFNNLAIKYSSNLSKLTDKKYVVDKMPNNYYFIGYIKMLFPNSKIIHTFRDPIATCFSNYQIFFSSEMMKYSCDLNYIVDVYKIYQKTINFWNQKNIDNLFHIKYEDLTENPEKYFKEIFKFLEIDFNESFLNFEKSSRAVTTASSNQLSNKIYKGSSEHWLHYKKHLSSLIKEFT